MTVRVYRMLLHLLPRRHRERFGDEMATVFAEQQRRADVAQTAALWMKETTGLLRFSAREWISRWRPEGGSTRGPRLPGGRLTMEMRWAWRGIRARRWRAVFIVMLLGIAMAANTVVFSAADSFVFNRAPYHDVSRLAVLEWQTRGSATDYLPADLIRQWREQKDLFEGIEAYTGGSSAYVTSGGVTEEIPGEFVTPRFLELLGVMPAYGRPFRNNETEGRAPKTAILADALSRRLFGNPAAAVGQSMTIGANRVEIIGVMPAGFRFPSAQEQIWMPFDPSAWPTFQNVRNVVRVVPGRPFDALNQAVADRMPHLSLPPNWANTTLTLATLTEARHDANATLVFSMLAGAAACLLNDLYGRLTADTRLAASITSGFGVLALIVATAGIYGVMAFLVAGRRREIGIRMALGADRRDVRRLVFSSSLRFVLAGAGVGLCAALVASRWISSQLFGITATDPATYATVTALIVVTAVTATWYPARQASRVDPAITLRAE